MRDSFYATCCGRSARNLIGVAVSAVTVGAATCSVADGLIVFDPLNYNESVLSAVRSLQQINIQVMSLTKQAQILINSTRNITSSPENIAAQLRKDVDEITQLMSQANGLTFRVSRTAEQFQSAYPMEYSDGTSADRLEQDGKTRRNNTYDAFNQALVVQSQAIEALNGDSANLAAVMTRSSGAIGALQAQQANNELLGLQVKQSMQTQAVVTTQARASALRDAERQASIAEAVERFRQFIGNGRAYTGGR
jgi:type IV secretion system protein TrbJ